MSLYLSSAAFISGGLKLKFLSTNSEALNEKRLNIF